MIIRVVAEIFYTDAWLVRFNSIAEVQDMLQQANSLLSAAQYRRNQNLETNLRPEVMDEGALVFLSLMEQMFDFILSHIDAGKEE